MAITPISNASWHKQLHQILSNLTKIDGSSRSIAILGVGNDLNGDDAIGTRIIRLLKSYQARGKIIYPVLLVDTGLAPENFIGLLRNQHPALIILIDAAQMGTKPGEIRCFNWEEITGMTSSTHTLPLSMISTYLIHELGCQVIILGIEPSHLDPFLPLSPQVYNAMRRVVHGISNLLSKENSDLTNSD